MGQLTVYRNNFMDSTIVSNLFIDEYMKDANDAQLKIYLYLLRVTGSDMSTSISDMADMFNHTEKDVVRALSYWEKHRLLSLDYDSAGSITGIHMKEPVDRHSEEIVPLAPVVSIFPQGISLPPQESVSAFDASSKAVSKKEGLPVKPDYSLDDVRAFSSRNSVKQLFFITEQYLQRPLTPSDINTIIFLSDELHFTDDLIDYLIQYCVERGKKDFRYIEKVALSWAENNVTTPKEAEAHSHKYDKTTYAIMNALGKSNSPTPAEIDFIKRWQGEYGFETDVIFEACQRTVLATENHRFEYADKILSSWKDAQVHHKADIQKIDELYQKKKNGTAFAKQPANKFNQFKQHDYDFDAIEQALLRK